MLETSEVQQPMPAPQPSMDQQQSTMYPPQMYPLPPYGPPQQPVPPTEGTKSTRMKWLIAVVVILALFIGGIVVTLAREAVQQASAEDNYKASITTVTISALVQGVQEGSSVTNAFVHFQGIVVGTGTISDETPMALIADSSDGNDRLLVAFAKGTDPSKIAIGDTIEIWGQEGGIVGSETPTGEPSSLLLIEARYFTNHTSGYSQ